MPWFFADHLYIKPVPVVRAGVGIPYPHFLLFVEIGDHLLINNLIMMRSDRLVKFIPIYACCSDAVSYDKFIFWTSTCKCAGAYYQGTMIINTPFTQLKGIFYQA